jgi:hypothetical protein
MASDKRASREHDLRDEFVDAVLAEARLRDGYPEGWYAAQRRLDAAADALLAFLGEGTDDKCGC